MNQTQITFETLKLISSFLTPLLVVLFGLIISKKLEKNKLAILKEKEWQVKWSEMFLKHATDYNDNISLIICSLFCLQTEEKQTNIDTLMNKISISKTKLQETDWNIQNYAQFSKLYGTVVIQTQRELMSMINNLLKEKKGDLEAIRKHQFLYNSAVRQAHNDILNSK